MQTDVAEVNPPPNEEPADGETAVPAEESKDGADAEEQNGGEGGTEDDQPADESAPVLVSLE